MYSGFFQSTNEATYVGISKGLTTLDTIFLNTNPPDWYSPQLCKAYIDKVADTLYLGVLINVPNTIEMRASVYKMDLTSTNLTEVYTDINFTFGNVIFRRGSFYGIPAGGGMRKKLNLQGQEEAIPVPASSSGGVTLLFSKNKIFAIISDSGSGSRVEVYSRGL
jgi:hypothetical protein